MLAIFLTTAKMRKVGVNMIQDDKDDKDDKDDELELIREEVM